jgi:hypothetical protein
VSILLWIVFGYYWYLVTNQALSSGVILAIKVLSLLVVLGIITTVYWVHHNERIALRNQRNTPRPSPDEKLDRDHIGRRVDSPGLAAIKLARVTEIDINDDNVKSYDVRDEVD